MIVVLMILAVGIGAQGPVGPPVLEFSLSSPGARSVGFGGVFIALADDATAAYTNPSGLTQLLDPEVSLEARLREYRTRFTKSGRVTGPPTGIGIDTNPGLEFSESVDETADVSFVSYVHPGRAWSVAVYRHQFASFESETRTQGLFGGDSCCENRYHDLVETTDLEIASYGVSYAYRVRDDLSLGLGLVYYTGRFSIVTDIFAPDDDTLEGRFAPSSYLPERRSVLFESVSDDDSIGLSAGFLWKVGPWQFGGAYRKGPTMAADLVGYTGPAYDPQIPTGTLLGRAEAEVEFPDVIGLGVAYRSQDGRITVGLEWDRVGYSSYVRSVGRTEGLDVSGMHIDDANEIHLGAEYVFLSSVPLIALRGGVWLDPDHRVRYDGRDPLPRAILQEGEDELHYAVGLGLVLARVQIDLGLDLSEIGDTASVSAIYSF